VNGRSPARSAREIHHAHVVADRQARQRRVRDAPVRHELEGADEAAEQYNALFDAWLAGLQDRDAADARTATRTIESNAEPDTVFTLISDPRRLPDWAPGFADAVSGDHESGWRATKNGQHFAVRVVAAHDARAVDYLHEIAPGREGGAYVRVVPRPGGGSVTSMTLPVPPGGDATAVTTIIRHELTALVQLAELR
jgi:Polyketide cyclase / dehydrase and lipid transport